MPSTFAEHLFSESSVVDKQLGKTFIIKIVLSLFFLFTLLSH